jgi:hypothetical protein
MNEEERQMAGQVRTDKMEGSASQPSAVIRLFAALGLAGDIVLPADTRRTEA